MKIQKIECRGDKTVIHLKVPEISDKTDKEFAEKLCKQLPALKTHFCDNETNRPFAEELKTTKTAHAFEHVLLHKIGEIDPGAFEIAAVTAWNRGKIGEGNYQIHLTYTDQKYLELAVLESLKCFQ